MGPYRCPISDAIAYKHSGLDIWSTWHQCDAAPKGCLLQAPLVFMIRLKKNISPHLAFTDRPLLNFGEAARGTAAYDRSAPQGSFDGKESPAVLQQMHLFQTESDVKVSPNFPPSETKNTPIPPAGPLTLLGVPSKSSKSQVHLCLEHRPFENSHPA